MVNLVHQLDRAGLTRRRIGGRLLLAPLLLVLIAGLVAPLFAAPYVLLPDYPEHLVRMWIIATIDQNPLLQRYYAIEWQALPNLAMELLVPPLLGFVGLAAAGRIFYIVTLAIILTGVHAVHAAMFRRLSPWPLVAVLFIHNRQVDGGVVNYAFGLGLSLWAFAAWVWLRERSWRTRFLACLVSSAVLYIAHLFGLAFYGLLVVAYEAWRVYRTGFSRKRQLAADVAAFAVPFAATLAILVTGATGGQADLIVWDSYGKVIGLYGVVSSYDDKLETGANMIAVAAIAWALITRRLRPHPVGWIVAAAAVAIFPVMPTMVFGSWGADARFPAGVCLVLIGLAQWRMPGRTEQVAFGLVLATLFLADEAVFLAAHRGYAAYEADLFRSFEQIEPGSRVLVTRERQSGLSWGRTMAFSRGPTLAIPERSVLVSNVYSHPGHHILVVKPPYRAISDGSEDPPAIIDDVLAAQGTSGQATTGGVHPFYATWRDSYDYVYVLFAKPDGPPLSDRLVLVATGDMFQLYRVVR
jgi:hypothetical protein